MKKLSTILAAAVLTLTAIGCASHEKSSASTYDNTSTTVTSK